MWNKVVNFTPMKTESVKIDSKIVAKVRGNKKKTGIPVGKFFELAATEKLKLPVNIEKCNHDYPSFAGHHADQPSYCSNCGEDL